MKDAHFIMHDSAQCSTEKVKRAVAKGVQLIQSSCIHNRKKISSAGRFSTGWNAIIQIVSKKSQKIAFYNCVLSGTSS